MIRPNKTVDCVVAGRTRRPVVATMLLLSIFAALLAGCGSDAAPVGPVATSTPEQVLVVPPTYTLPARVASVAPSSTPTIVPVAAPTLTATAIVPVANEAPKRAEVGKPAPDFSIYRLQDGARIWLSAQRGKPVWINFWATTCGICMTEIPEMQYLYKKYQGQFEIFGIGSGESAPTMQHYIDANSFSWNFALDQERRIQRLYPVPGLPSHIFVDRDGIVDNIVIGYLDPKRMKTQIESMLQ